MRMGNIKTHLFAEIISGDAGNLQSSVYIHLIYAGNNRGNDEFNLNGDELNPGGNEYKHRK